MHYRCVIELTDYTAHISLFSTERYSFSRGSVYNISIFLTQSFDYQYIFKENCVTNTESINHYLDVHILRNFYALFLDV